MRCISAVTVLEEEMEKMKMRKIVRIFHANIYTVRKLPDPIYHVFSLTGKYIPENYFTYRPVQIFKILFPEILFSRI